VVPFHFWLADAYALAPTAAGVLFAGVVSELGLYAVARVYWTVFSVGLTLAGFALLGPAGAGGAVLDLVADGLVKGSLFITKGIVDHHLRDVDERRLQGRGRHMPWAAALMVLGALGLAGVPPFGTFIGKALMEEAALSAGHPWLIALFVVVAALTSAALLRATGRVFPTRLDFLRGDYMNQLDLNLMREFGLRGHRKLQVRVDAINALNNVQWDRPNTSPTSSNFGVVTQQWNTPRWIQVQGRLTF
jgi:formate hydrogenlyase subunit 3/multisubunit Na+/H+ antiporter MnhD subunit